MVRLGYMLIVSMLCLFACSDNNDDSSVNETKKTIIDPQLQALEKAKGVEQQLLDAAEQQSKLIEAREN